MKKNYVLGLNFSHSDSSACLFENNELVVAAEEERFLRVKHTTLFPFNAIKFCLTHANINISYISVITINSRPASSIIKKILFLLQNPSAYKIAINSVKNTRTKLNLKDYISKIDKKNNFSGRIFYADHHKSHIASSLYFSGFEECANLSVDGFGDFASCAWGYFRNKNLKLDSKIYFPHSLGIYYQAMTQFLGFKNYGDEYKVMGLSPYGKPKYIKEISNLINKTKHGFNLNLKYFEHHKKKILQINKNSQAEYLDLYSSKLFDLLGKERNKNDEITQYHMDIANSIQSVYEDIFFHLLDIVYKKYHNPNLTLSGGCAMNSVANGKIIKKTPFKNIYISPNPGDGGGSVGSACVYLSNQFKKKVYVKNYSYLGPKFNNDEIKNIINKFEFKKNYSINFMKDEEVSNYIAKELVNSKVIGWFQDRTEWGPRALGNRSILADPRNPNIKKIINSKIKRRESFRPFAPSIIYEEVHKWFDIKKDVPFMSEVYQVKENKQKLLPGITHIDGSGRVQTVKKEENLKYYNLIRNFFELTEVPVILNTSFNENEPIVNHPLEALNCFHRTEMDILVLENYILTR
jgi:carbamoyltransferase